MEQKWFAMPGHTLQKLPDPKLQAFLGERKRTRDEEL